MTLTLFGKKLAVLWFVKTTAAWTTLRKVVESVDFYS